MTLQWSHEETEEFVRYARNSFSTQDRAVFEKTLRDGTEHGTSAAYDVHEHTHRFQRGQDDVIGQCVDEVWNSGTQFLAVVQEALECATATYERAKEKGLKDGLKLPEQVDRQIMSTAWKQAFTKSLIKASVAKIQGVCANRATDGALCAISDEDYSALEPDVISAIMHDGLEVIRGYAGVNKSTITREMEFIQFNGLFNKNQDVSSVYEGCSTLWIKVEHLSPHHQKETMEVVKRLKLVPFELCKRCKLMLQVISFLRIILMEGEDVKIKRHKDAVECGVMFTLLYIASIQSERVASCLIVEVAGGSGTREIRLEQDMLIILRSDVYYEVKPAAGKMFIISAWITGAKS